MKKSSSTSRTPQTIDDYIAGFPADVQERLQALRDIIRKAAPQAVEKISYMIPTFHLHGNLVHFAGYRSHIGFYPGSQAIAEFADDLTGYVTAKGTLQLPLDRPLPHKLISKMVTFCVKNAEAKAAAKGVKSKTKIAREK